MKAVEAANQRDMLQVLLSIESVHEYTAFFSQYINQKYRVKPITSPISKFFNPKAIIVTGEHGDQLFGRHLLKSYVSKGSAHLDYRDYLPIILTERFGNPLDAYRVMG